MYKTRHSQPEFVDFYLPFGGKLRSDNRWVILANLIPWSEFEESYSKKFKSKNRRGAPSLSVRIALGSLIIKDELESSDIETIQQL